MYRLVTGERATVFYAFNLMDGNHEFCWSEIRGEKRVKTQQGFLSSSYGNFRRQNDCFNVQFEGTQETVPEELYFDHTQHVVGDGTSLNGLSAVRFMNRWYWGGRPRYMILDRNLGHHGEVIEHTNPLSVPQLDNNGYLLAPFTFERWWVNSETGKEVPPYRQTVTWPVGTKAAKVMQLPIPDYDIHFPSKMDYWTAEYWHHMAFTNCKLQAGDLTTDCMKDLKSLDINTCTAVPGIINITKDIRNLIEAAEGKVSVKWLINVYLQMLYGTSNTVRDIHDLSLAFVDWAHGAVFGRSKTQKVKSAQTENIPQNGSFFPAHTVRHGLNLEVETLDSGLADIVRKSMDLDVFPELGNVWDIVPYSFVIDWFLPLGDLLDQIDAGTYRSALHFVDGSYSRQSLVHGVSPLRRAVPWLQGDSILKVYERRVLASIPEPILTLHTPHEFNQWIPAGALALQQFLK